MNEEQARHLDSEHRSIFRTVIPRLAWFAFLFFCVFTALIYSVASSFPLHGRSEPRVGAAAMHEAIGASVMRFTHYPFTWLYSFMPGKTASLVIMFCWALLLYFISALLRRPRFIFVARHELQ